MDIKSIWNSSLAVADKGKCPVRLLGYEDGAAQKIHAEGKGF